jgi:hypothetical protein
MRMTWWTLIVAAGLAAGFTGQASAQTASPYAVTPAAGAWLICVPINYMGATGTQLAHDLVGELRQRGLPAYLFNNAADKQKEQDRIAQLKQQNEQAMQEFAKQMGAVPARGFKGVRTYHVEDQWVVLIAGPKAGWQTMDEARKALDGVRKLEPPSPKLLDVAVVRVPTEKGDEVVKAAVNPFLSAFVVHNPTVQRTPDPEANAYPWLRAFNDGMPYSLLKNPKRWTLVVKQFQGPSAIQTNNAPGDGFLKKIGLGSNSTDVLSATAQQAVEMARFLRELKFEAYVLHTPYKSVVCVGGFDSKDDPNIAQTHHALTVTFANLKVVSGPAIDVNSLLFSQPIPLEVPRP